MLHMNLEPNTQNVFYPRAPPPTPSCYVQKWDSGITWTKKFKNKKRKKERKKVSKLQK